MYLFFFFNDKNTIFQNRFYVYYCILSAILLHEIDFFQTRLYCYRNGVILFSIICNN